MLGRYGQSEGRLESWAEPEVTFLDLIYRPRGRGEMASMGGSQAVQEPRH
jgi:hypothetical protein